MNPEKDLSSKIEKPTKEVTAEFVEGHKNKSLEERIADTKKIVEFTRYLVNLHGISSEQLLYQLEKMDKSLEGEEMVDLRDDVEKMKNITP